MVNAATYWVHALVVICVGVSMLCVSPACTGRRSFVPDAAVRTDSEKVGAQEVRTQCAARERCFALTSVATPAASAPERLGTLAGAGAPNESSAQYGASGSVAFEHQGAVRVLLRDTRMRAGTPCSMAASSGNADAPAGAEDSQDNMLAILPSAYSGRLPTLEYLNSTTSDTLQLYRDGTRLSVGRGEGPLAAFSDGQRAYALFERLGSLQCEGTSREACLSAGFSCSMDGVGTLCIDDTSSQYEPHAAGQSAAAVRSLEVAVAREASPAVFDSLFTWATNKFSRLAVKSVAKFASDGVGADYGPGHDTLLVWGRPGAVAEHGRQAQLYLMSLHLPFQRDVSSMLDWQPQYFAGLEPYTGRPIWSPQESEAKSIALDGKPGGDAHEVEQITGSFTISWIGAPIRKWVMLYGGDVPDNELADAASARSLRAPGAILLRFADHPWGPFSPSVPHLDPGSPLQEGAAYGPGGFVFHPACVADGTASCVASDPFCSDSLPTRGWLSNPNILEAYGAPDSSGGFEFFWTVATGNPYGIQLMRTRLSPPSNKLDVAQSRPLADSRGLERLANWSSLPTLGNKSRYTQQTSREHASAPILAEGLFRDGNRDFNNFRCKSPDARVSKMQLWPMRFDQTHCDEPYVRGAVMARIVGPGRHVRTWLGMASLMTGPADDEVLRIYVDDEEQPRIEMPLAKVLDGRSDERFAPPYGAGSARRMAWYYPVAFEQKLIVTLDNLGENDAYFYQCDALLNDPSSVGPATDVPELQNDSALQLSSLYHPAGTLTTLRAPETINLRGGEGRIIHLGGPSTIDELRVRLPDSDYPRIAHVELTVRWDSESSPAIDIPLRDLFGSGNVPPQRSSAALTSYSEQDDRVLALKLPMPFERDAELHFKNSGVEEVSFELALLGSEALPMRPFGHLHVQSRETVGPTNAPEHVAVEAYGLGRLAGVCGYAQGHVDPELMVMTPDHLNLLEGDVTATVDGAVALDGTGTEEYADDVFYFAEAPRGNAFTQAWGVVNYPEPPPGSASFCRWHVRGTELDFASSLQLKFELGGSHNPGIVERLRTVAYLYQ